MSSSDYIDVTIVTCLWSGFYICSSY